jgi:uncharacterized protein YdeI (YjbR/CyaY-like superfamily)
MYGGKILANMAAFKAHCAFGFWNREVVGENDKERNAMSQFGRIASVKDLPTKAELAKYVKLAMASIDAGTKRVPKHEPKPAAEAPPELIAALKKNAAARKTFEAFAPSHKREYVEWIVEAKREETRARRIAQTLEWLAEGKKRNWKYENC